MTPNGLSEEEADKLKQELLDNHIVALSTTPRTLSALCGEKVPRAWEREQKHTFALQSVTGGHVMSHARELFPTPESAQFFSDRDPERLWETDFARRLRYCQSHRSFRDRKPLYAPGFDSTSTPEHRKLFIW